MKIAVLSDIHLKQNRKQEKFNLPISFYILYQQIKEILLYNPDIMVINGDLIDNASKLDIQVLNFVTSIFNNIYKQMPNLKIFILQGNHDVVFLNKSIQSYGSFINIFKNSTNIVPLLQNRKVKVINDLNMFFLPYTTDVDGIYKFLEQNKNYNYGIYFLHQDIDFMHVKFTKQKNVNYSNGKMINIEKLISLISDGGRINYDDFKIISGHYHYHYNNTKYNTIILGQSNAETFSEKVKGVEYLDKYFGWNMIEYKTKNNVNYEFIPFKYGINSLHYYNWEDFMVEFPELKERIYNDYDKKYYQIRIEGKNVDKNEQLKSNIQELIGHSNVLECRHINMFDIGNTNGLYNYNDLFGPVGGKKFDLIEYFQKQIHDNIKGTSLQSIESKLMVEFKNIVEQ